MRSSRPPRPTRADLRRGAAVRRGAALAATGAVLVGLLGACTDDPADSGPDPRDAAEALADALAAGDLTGVELAGTDPAAATGQLTWITERLGEDRPEVEVQDVEVEDVDAGEDTATATLAWRWPLGGPEPDEGWRYTATAELVRTDDTWQVAWSPRVVEPSLADDELLDRTTIDAARGRVMGARGLAIVTQRPVLRLGVDRSTVGKPQAVRAARALARLVDVDAASYSRQVRAAGERAFVEAITYRRDDVPADVAQGYRAIDGVLGIADELPLAPTREFAAPVLGTVGPVTAEMVEEDPERNRPGDVAGLSGLQARYDDRLRGTPGYVVEAVSDDPAGGDDARELVRVDAVPGEDLRLTLDPDLQLAAEEILADVGPASAIVALRPGTGDLVAVANGPGTEGYNIATYGQLAPGSTFKSVTALALLRAGLRPDTEVPCTESLVVDGKRFTNYSDYPAEALGRIPLRTAMAHSCNTAFLSQAGRLGDTDLADAAASLGLGPDHDLGFPAFFGAVDPPASETEAAADLIGQGTVLASPMVMAAVIGSVQAGELVVPRLVESVEVAASDGVQPLSDAEARALRGMLRGVVTSGSGRGLADVPGGPVIAKTGTAEFGPAGKVRTHAWMIAARDDLAVAVFVEVGESGSGTAGPLLEEFLRAAG